MTGDLVALAERAERATGPDKGLDWDIAEALSLPRPLDASYSISLDAAMSLVPEGWVVASLEWWPMRDRGGVCLREVKNFDAIGGYGFGFDETCGDARANARTASLALVSAALRARAQESGHG